MSVMSCVFCALIRCAFCSIISCALRCISFNMRVLMSDTVMGATDLASVGWGDTEFLGDA